MRTGSHSLVTVVFLLCMASLGTLGYQEQNATAEEEGLHGNPTRFHVVNCSLEGDKLYVTDASITPDPIRPGQNALVTVRLNITENMYANFTIQTILEKHIFFFWKKLGCYSDFGSCSFPDLCTLLDPSFSQLGQNCAIPLTEGSLSFKEASLFVPTINLPGFLLNGKYKMTVKAWDPISHKQLGCFRAIFSLHK